MLFIKIYLFSSSHTKSNCRCDSVISYPFANIGNESLRCLQSISLRVKDWNSFRALCRASSWRVGISVRATSPPGRFDNATSTSRLLQGCSCVIGSDRMWHVTDSGLSSEEILPSSISFIQMSSCSPWIQHMKDNIEETFLDHRDELWFLLLTSLLIITDSALPLVGSIFDASCFKRLLENFSKKFLNDIITRFSLDSCAPEKIKFKLN